MNEEHDRLISAIDRLEKTTKRSTNLGWNLLRGFFYGFGWIIGLATIATMVYYLLPQTGEGNFVGKFIHAMADALRAK